jgi:glycosyltransferase involved in cell wall biosynthesis
MDNPKVSVLTLTYNQKSYIVQALESVLEQFTDFDFEMIVCDDCSSDKTPEILKDYQHKYPDKIRLFLNEKNIGLYRNMVQAFFACTGQYIAILEGDDYWTSPHKLQKQVDFLDSNPGCTICFHNAKSISDQNLWEPVIFCPDSLKEISTLKDIILLNYIPTLSVMYRRGVIQEIPTWVSKLRMTDWPLHLLHAQQGDIGYIDEIMGVYRVHGQGIWSSLPQTGRIKEIIKMLETANIYFDYQYESIINESLANFNNQLIESAQHPLQQTLDRLDHTLAYERSESQNHIQHLQSELKNAQFGLAYYQNEFIRLQSQHSQLQGVLAYTQSQFLQTQSEVQSLQQSLLQQSSASQTRISDLKERLQKKRQQVQYKKIEIEAYQAQVTAMETSKFWKLRKGWFKLKRSLGLPIDE